MENKFEKYFYIYSFCFITSGEDYFSIYDSFKGKLHIFDTELYEIASSQLRSNTINQILSIYDKDDRRVIIDFLDYLESHCLGRYVSDITLFPVLEENWDAPYTIKRCIIDIRHIWHNFDCIFHQLSELLCPKIELRFFENIVIDKLQEVINVFERYDFGVLFLLLPYYEKINEHLSLFSDIVKHNFRVFFNIYSVPEIQWKSLSGNVKNDLYLSNNVRLSTKIVKGRNDCGTIKPHNLHALSIQEVMENKLYNGCLNRLISIDEDGFIRNCPSMPNNYGNIANISLTEVVAKQEFKHYWTITNSTIDRCSSCEFRIICLGCRAYTKDSNNLFSAPSRCLRLLNSENEY